MELSVIGVRTSDLALYARVLRESWRYRWHLFAIAALSLLATPLALLQPLPVQLVVDSVLDGRPLPEVLTMLLPASAQSSTGLLIFACALLIVTTLLQQVEGFGSWLLQLYTGERLVLEFRARLFAHFQRLAFAYHDTRGTADSLYRLQFDASSVQYIVISGLIPLLTATFMLVSMVAVTAWLDWQLALVAITVAPVLFVMTELYRRVVRGWWAQVKEAEAAALGTAHETLSALRVVKAFGQEDRHTTLFSGRLWTALRKQLKAVLAETTFGLSVALATAVGTAAVLYIGVRHVEAGVITLGQLLLVVAYLAQLYKPLENISKTIAGLQASLAGAERAFAVLDRPSDVAASPHPRRLERARGDLELHNVSFGYAPDLLVLREVTLAVPAGSRVGITGASGVGKSTLLSLLPRFADPIAGHIQLDGVDIRAYALTDLRRQFAIVLQEPVLFTGTVAENIAYGRPDATLDQIIAAAKAANIHDFIARLPKSYQTHIGERGMTLSGGERQRISLARAFLKDAPILLLDEPTSSVDHANEALILDALERLMVGRTTFMVAHRLNTLRVCDIRLIVDCDGYLRQESAAGLTHQV